jgi:UDP-glucose:(heptosyl)LPS alpha-1,3-glucosyltransferase
MQMKIAFCLFKYFPYGGLQRDFARIARTCHQRGHEVHVYTMRWDGDIEPGLRIHIIPATGKQNHTRNRAFADHVQSLLAVDNPDLVVGFNKMPHLDIYYAADVCYQARARQRHGFLYRLLPRYRQLIAHEQSIFAPGNQTQILLISPKQQPEFIQYYQTESERFHILPPGISKNCIAPSDAAHIRAELRNNYHLTEDHSLLLLVGSGFKTKGLDRAIRGLASLPEDLRNKSQLFVIGQDNPTSFQKLAKRLKVANQVHFLGGRLDVPHFLLAADLLVHPAYHENTGTVLLEAVISGLPVLTVDVCGYAHYIAEANAGLVLTSPFQQAEFNRTLEKMLISSEHQQWQKNGLAFAHSSDIYSLAEKTADLIEQVGRKRVSE